VRAEVPRAARRRGFRSQDTALRREHSLRAAVTLWLLVTASAMLLLIGALWLPALRVQFQRASDDVLVRDAEALSARVVAQEPYAIDDDGLRALLESERLTARVLAAALHDGDGRATARWNTGIGQLPALEREPSSGPLVPRFARVRGARPSGGTTELSWITLPFRDHGRLGFVSLAEPARSWTPTWGTIAVAAGIAALVLAIGVPLAGRVVARRLLAPLQGLVESARAVSPRNPGTRFRLRARDAELRRLEEELNDALRRMEDGVRTQAQFAGNVAHELKTPIAALLADTQVVRHAGPSLEESSAFLDRAEEELLHLGNLVESFLVMARIETQVARADLVYVDDVVRRAEKRCRRSAERAGVALTLDLAAARGSCDPFVCGDLELLQAMIENLIRNAVAHSPGGEAVVVRTSCEADTVQIAVRDSGCGIAEEHRQRVFERGVQILEEESGAGGQGLGLSIVRNVAQIHGGRVSVEVNADRGSTFLVALPSAGDPAREGVRAVTDS